VAVEMNKRLHIVCFNVPYPADHGGMFDLFFKILALHNAGIEIILHCFEYGKGEQPELNKYCVKVFYYKRITGLRGFSFSLPYIISSRISHQLIKNLKADHVPVLLEGTHTTYMVKKDFLPGRKIFLRMHNIEQVYYYHLFESEKNLLKKLYYWHESRLLKKYEDAILRKVSYLLPVSQKDATTIKGYHSFSTIQYLPVFLPFQQVNILTGKGDYCLYHGNLSIAENNKAVEWLVNTIDTTQLPLIVAGRNPSATLIRFLQSKKVRLVMNPTDDEMFHLVQNAHINLILSFNETGIKIKLLNALFHGRHCICNEAAIPGSEFSDYCSIFSSPGELNTLITDLKDQPFTEQQAAERSSFLLQHFNSKTNAEKLSALL